MEQQWNPNTWRDKPLEQQPHWPESSQVSSVYSLLRSMPPLVFAGEARELRNKLAAVSQGNAFLLQAGDCAESFASFTADTIRDRLRVILQMAVVLAYSSGVPVVKVGRIAGQYAKPRSSPTETVDGVTLPSFRGHIVNDIAFNESARTPQPERLLQAYNHAASTLNLLRAFTKGGFADLTRVHEWTQEFVSSSNEGKRYEVVADEISRAMSFMKACGIDAQTTPQLHSVDFYTSHEALLLEYEQALTRQDSITGNWYDCSAHMLWIGERTRQLDGAHVEFLSGVHNPIGCKVGPSMSADDVLALCAKLNPENIPGRLTLITRMGANVIEEKLPPLLQAVKDENIPVVWACDPMHGNTFTAPNGRKTRHLDDILAEIAGFFRAHQKVGTWAGGVHVELAGDDVTECLGGAEEILDTDLNTRYETMCDPRLNARQSVDLAFRVAELLRS